MNTLTPIYDLFYQANIPYNVNTISFVRTLFDEHNIESTNFSYTDIRKILFVLNDQDNYPYTGKIHQNELSMFRGFVIKNAFNNNVF